MTKVFKLTSRRVPRTLVQYERGILQDIIAGLVLPEEEETPETILMRARREAEQKVREAYAEGLRKGFDAGKEQFEASVAQAGSALNAAATAIREARQQFIEALTPQVVELAVAVAGRILQREAATDPELIVRTAERALVHLANHEHVTVRVNPADLEAIKARRVQLLEQVEGVSRLSVIADESVSSGGCLASSVLMEADARIESQLSALLDVLHDVDGAITEE